MNTEQKWYKSATLWTAIVGQGVGLLLLVNIVDVTRLEAWKTISYAVINLLITLGILSNPTTNHAAEIKAAAIVRRAKH